MEELAALLKQAASLLASPRRELCLHLVGASAGVALQNEVLPLTLHHVDPEGSAGVARVGDERLVVHGRFVCGEDDQKGDDGYRHYDADGVTPVLELFHTRSLVSCLQNEHTRNS